MANGIHAADADQKPVGAADGGNEPRGALAQRESRAAEPEGRLEDLDEARGPDPVLARRRRAAAERPRPAALFEIRIEDDSHWRPVYLRLHAIRLRTQ